MKAMTRRTVVAIVGTRTKNKDDFKTVLSKVQELFNKLSKDKHIILSGGAGSGADWAAKLLAQKGGWSYLEAVAAWRVDGKFNKHAGFDRNGTIAELADIVYAVWDGKSNGTRDTITKAKARGKTVIVVPL